MILIILYQHNILLRVFLSPRQQEEGAIAPENATGLLKFASCNRTQSRTLT